MADLVEELIELVAEDAQALGCSAEIDGLRAIVGAALRRPGSALHMRRHARVVRRTKPH